MVHYDADPGFRETYRYARRSTALFFAATKPRSPRSRRKDNTAMIRTLISHGAWTNATNYEQKTPLLVADAEKAIKRAQTPLDIGTNVMGETPRPIPYVTWLRRHLAAALIC